MVVANKTSVLSYYELIIQDKLQGHQDVQKRRTENNIQLEKSEHTETQNELPLQLIKTTQRHPLNYRSTPKKITCKMYRHRPTTKVQQHKKRFKRLIRLVLALSAYLILILRFDVYVNIFIYFNLSGILKRNIMTPHHFLPPPIIICLYA